MDYRGKTCVVSGAAGAIGSRLCIKLHSLGAKVIAVDNLSSGYEWLLPDEVLNVPQSRVGPMYDTRKISDFSRALQAETRTCVVFHLAAHFANQNSVEHPIEDLRTNGEGTLAMLEWAAGRAEKFVFASAGCAVGHEDTPYQIHKTLGETYCRYYSDRVPTVVCRFHNSYGPGELPGLYRNVIPNWIWSAMNDRAFTVYGDGTDSRDFIYVDDLVEDVLAAEPCWHPYAFGTGRLTRVYDLAKLVLKCTGSSARFNFEPSRRWDHAGEACDNPTARSKVGLDEGIRRTVEWFKAHKARIEDSIG